MDSNWGGIVGANVIIGRDFACGERELVTIGDNVNMSSEIQLILHDGSNTVPEHLGLSPKGARRYGKIIIGNNVFIGARVTICTNVRIGNNVIIGAGAVVTKSIPDNSVAAGVPARVLETIEEYCDKNLFTFIPIEGKDRLKEIVSDPE